MSMSVCLCVFVDIPAGVMLQPPSGSPIAASNPALIITISGANSYAIGMITCENAAI